MKLGFRGGGWVSSLSIMNRALSVAIGFLHKTATVTGSFSELGQAPTLLFASRETRRITDVDLISGSLIDGVDKEQGVATYELIYQSHGAEKAVFLKTDVGIGHDEAVRSTGRLNV